MRLRQCILKHNDCYRAGRTITPQGVMVHSTGANNPNLRRYVQPDDGVLGINQNNNHWNQAGIEKCVHAFIGRTADGSVATYQTLPWTMRGWHAGGKANNTHIGFEICEDNLQDADYFAAVYREAVELTAHLCGMFGLDPLMPGVVLCHKEGYRRGIASNHSDVEHWFPRHGESMDRFRAAVALEMKRNIFPADPEEEENMTGEEIYTRLQAYLNSQSVPEWAVEELKDAVALGVTDGMHPMELVPRYQAAIMAKRALTQAKRS